jgi:hypothetical protein
VCAGLLRFLQHSEYEVQKLQLYVKEKHLAPLAASLESEGYNQYDLYLDNPENNEGYMVFQKRDSDGETRTIDLEYDVKETAIHKLLGLAHNAACLHFIS